MTDMLKLRLDFFSHIIITYHNNVNSTRRCISESTLFTISPVKSTGFVESGRRHTECFAEWEETYSVSAERVDTCNVCIECNVVVVCGKITRQKK